MGAAKSVELLVPYVSLLVAVLAGLFSLWNTSRISKQSSKLERLKSKLDHEQLVHSTQWAVKFSAYQALWKSLVPVGALADKLIMRESELVDIGLEQGDVAFPIRLENRKKLLEKYIRASSDCMLAIHEQAPFYAADVREVANGVHGTALGIYKRQMGALVSLNKGQSLIDYAATVAGVEGRAELIELMSGPDVPPDLQPFIAEILWFRFGLEISSPPPRLC